MPNTGIAPEQLAIETGEQLKQITEAGAAAAAPWVGSGAGLNDKSPQFEALKIAADGDAVEAMEHVIKTGSWIVLACEGKKDKAPMVEPGVYSPEGVEPQQVLILDPIERTTAVIKGEPGGMSVGASLPVGRFPEWSGFYMKKLAVPKRAGPALQDGTVNIKGDPWRNINEIADALELDPRQIRIAALERDRNRDIFEAAKRIGAQVIKLEGGDILPIMQMLMDEEEDLILYSSGGVTEGLAAAVLAAIKGGGMQAMADPQNKTEVEQAFREGLLGRPLNLVQLAGTEGLHFSASGITRSQPEHETSDPILHGWSKDESGAWLRGTSIATSRISKSRGLRM